MIQSVEEFITLRDSNDPRAIFDNALLEVWMAVIQNYPDYKRWVLQNKNVPVDVVRLLAYDTDPNVRFWVAQKRKCPFDILKVLSQDSDESVRERIAWNENTPSDVLEILKNDQSQVVSRIATQRLTERQRQRQLKGN